MFIQGFYQKVLLLGQSYNSALGFSSIPAYHKKKILFFLDYVFIHIKRFSDVEPKLIKYQSWVHP